MDVRPTGRFAFKAAILAIVLGGTAAASVLSPMLSPAAAAGRGISIARAEAAAREAVRAHDSYRRINPSRSGLVTRSCWRAPAARVRCSLYVVAPTPCALDANLAGDVCAQVISKRRWLVEVRRGPHGPAARILTISSGPSTAAP
jgi:hypothetical protein